MTIDKMEHNLLNCKQHQQTVRVQSRNALATGTVSDLSNGVLSLQTKNGAKNIKMIDVDNYKIMK